jgi:NOL1/NOP2/fmu family ribosome biogenesis protein
MERSMDNAVLQQPVELTEDELDVVSAGSLVEIENVLNNDRVTVQAQVNALGNALQNQKA